MMKPNTRSTRTLPNSSTALPNSSTFGSARGGLSRVSYAVVLAFLLLAPAGLGQTKKPAADKATAEKPAATPVATVGGRRIEERDIQQAALVLGSDPLRKRNPTAWKRMLLNRCVDRELLAMEAVRRGLDKDPIVLKRIAGREYEILQREVYARVLVPGLIPTPEQLKKIRAGSLYRSVDIYYILIRDEAAGANRGVAQRVFERAKAGARFDSLAKIYSGHPPSRAAGGHFGWVLTKDLDAASYEDVRKARPGDVVGVYTNPYGHAIYKIGGFDDLSEDSLSNLIYIERRRGIDADHQNNLLAKYNFALDSTQVKPLLFAVGSETPDSILASLGPDGTRPSQGVRPALGIIARCDGDSVTFPMILRISPPLLGPTGRMKLTHPQEIYARCARVVLQRLSVRDAIDRGIDKNPAVARELRLMRDEIRTQAMVARELSTVPDDAALRTYFTAHSDRYRRPRASVARVAVFASPESAAAALEAWGKSGMTDTLLAARQLRPAPGAMPTSLYPGSHTTLALLEGESDALSRAVVGVPAGSTLRIVATVQGYAVVQVLSVEESRAYTFEEHVGRVRRDWQDEVENDWVVMQLERLRARTPVRVIAGRLEAIRLHETQPSEGGGR